MKKIKRFVSFLLAMVMVMAMSMTAMADTTTTYTITINNSEAGHIYEAYQIFTGDYAELIEDGKTVRVLSNVVWGSGVTTDGQTKMGDAAAKAKNLDGKDTDGAEAKAFAQEVANYLSNTVAGTASRLTVKESKQYYEITGLAAGYYLIKDQDNSQKTEIGTGDKKEAYTYYIMEVVDDVDVTVKESVPSVTKKVYDTNDTTTAAVTDITQITDASWVDSADYDISDSVPFRLQATLGDNVDYYSTYKVVFNDTLAKGLTYNNDAKVMIGEEDITNEFNISEANGTLTILCDNVLASSIMATNNSVITVYYTAVLNENAVVGNEGNVNKVYLEYSNDPNTGKNSTGTTPVDKVQVFTYEVEISKVDDDKEALTGAQFTLEKLGVDRTTWTVAKTATLNDEGTKFTFKGLDDGTYRLTETTTPAGYNTMEPLVFDIAATHSVEGVTALTGTDQATSAQVTFAANTVDGILTADVVNEKGVVLPSTGGIGTTIFYVAGGLMVAVAGVLLVTRKRMESQEK